ncbi:MAG: NYN domain-containing protein [Sulfurovaceae bacterium]|nr:NYN domain-containing protein [Sulfurovaceae bacterium]MDD5548651.1 NYN domain-containing protein [Sulfurovaceae bacterium]
MEKEQNIALLIDCDNVSYHAISGVLNELAKYGVINIRRAYGNWKSSNMQGWESQLHPYAIAPIQQFSYTSGKNATDIAMVIDAMDLLYTKSIDAFAFMTSDSDFTPMVMRILANGLKVYGFGEQKTPESFVNACSQFIYTENLELSDEEAEKVEDVESKLKRLKNKLRGDSGLVKNLRTAIEQTAEDDGWSHLGKIGQYISNNTSLSPVNYGLKKWSDLIRAIELFEIDMRKNNSEMYIKDKRKK